MQLQTKLQERFSNVINVVPHAVPDLHKVLQSDGAVDVEDPRSPNDMGSLPVLATASDVREVVKFLKRRPLGVSITEMMNAEPRRIFEARKIAAYEFWGIIRRESQRVVLTERGADLAERLEPESQLYRVILNTVPAYIAAANWIYASDAEVVTHREVSHFWRTSDIDLGFDHLEGKDEEAAVVSFFSLCHAAEIGTATVGKRGQPARLRVDQDQLRVLLNTPLSETNTPGFAPRLVGRIEGAESSSIERVYISTNSDDQQVDQLRNVLCLADFDSVAVRTPNAEDGLLPPSHISAMQQCQAAIFIVDRKNLLDEKEGTAGFPGSLLTELNVALALLGGRVILFSNSPIKTLMQPREDRLHILESRDFEWESCIRLATLLKALRN